MSLPGIWLRDRISPSEHRSERNGCGSARTSSWRTWVSSTPYSDRAVKIVIAGGTGFLGRPLTERLLAEGHDVVVLTRGGASQMPARAVVWSPGDDVGSGGRWAGEIDGAYAVVNLAGESIAGRRWSAAHK